MVRTDLRVTDSGSKRRGQGKGADRYEAEIHKAATEKETRGRMEWMWKGGAVRMPRMPRGGCCWLWMECGVSSGGEVVFSGDFFPAGGDNVVGGIEGEPATE
jgi:hypothetical protein